MKIVAAWSNLKADISSGKGYLFLTVILLRPWKSMQGWRVLFIFTTKKTPATREAVDVRMMPACMMYFVI